MNNNEAAEVIGGKTPRRQISWRTVVLGAVVVAGLAMSRQMGRRASGGLVALAVLWLELRLLARLFVPVEATGPGPVPGDRHRIVAVLPRRCHFRRAGNARGTVQQIVAANILVLGAGLVMFRYAPRRKRKQPPTEPADSTWLVSTDAPR